MSELESRKSTAIQTLQSLCPRCQRHEAHTCPVMHLVEQVQSLRGVPIRVNDQLHSVVFMNA